MSLLTKASLVMTPNAIKESKVYSIIPSSGNGDLTFTRGTNASGTLNNDNLLIENAPYNLISNSNVFTSAYYNKSLVAVTSNTIASITGAVNASTLTEVAGTNSHHIHENVGSFTPVVGTSYTMSCYLKQPTSSANRYVQLPFFIAGFGSNAYVNFDLQTLTKGTIGASITSSDISLISNGWIRITATAVATATGASGFQLSLIPASTSTRTQSYTVTAGSENSIYIYGFQVVLGTVAKDYFNTTDRLNVPRLNYDSVGGCPSLLLEPQITNLLLNSVWTGGGTIPTSWTVGFANSGTSTPITSVKNLSVTAYRFVTTSLQRQEFYQIIALALNSVTSFSTYVEQVTTPITIYQLLRVGATSTGIVTPVYLKNNVVVASSDNIEAGFTYTLQVTCIVAGTFQFRIGSGVNNTVAGNFVLSMPQLETGSYSTSYIPTTSGSVTRNADECYKIGVSTDILNASEGTFYVEAASIANDLTDKIIEITDGSDNNRIQIDFGFANNSLRLTSLGGGAQYTEFVIVSNITSYNKILIKWGSLGKFAYVNGTKYTLLLVAGTGSGIPTALNQITFRQWGGGTPFYGRCKGMQIYKTALSDAECAALTT